MLITCVSHDERTIEKKEKSDSKHVEIEPGVLPVLIQ